MRGEPVVYGGKLMDDTYGNFQEEMDMINKAFCEIMIEGDATGKIFTFPIPTYNITKDFDWESEVADKIFDMTAKYGIPYFQNFINSSLKPEDIRSMCCRLQLRLDELHNKTGGLFGAGDSTGSIGVVTINLPRIGYESKTEKQFFKRLDDLMEYAKTSLEIKRMVIEKNIENNLLPYTKRYLGTMEHHFSTIGVVGGHECCLNFLNKGIETKEGKEFIIKVLDYMLEKLKDFQEETGNLYNLEATPAEGTGYRLAKIDKSKYSEIITAGDGTPYYTNSTLLPVGYTDDVFNALDHQDELQCKYTSGTVFHVFLGEALNDGFSAKTLVKRMVEKYHLPYISITPTFSICRQHGYIKGEHLECPTCGEYTNVYSRVVGYFRPVQNWNKGKRKEFNERKTYKIGG